MAKAEYVKKGEVLDFENTTAAEIGYNDVVPLKNRIGVSREVIPVNSVGSVVVTGVFELPAVTTAAFAVGEPLYWDAATGKVVKTAGDISAGYAFADKIQTGAVALVKIG